MCVDFEALFFQFLLIKLKLLFIKFDLFIVEFLLNKWEDDWMNEDEWGDDLFIVNIASNHLDIYWNRYGRTKPSNTSNVYT